MRRELLLASATRVVGLLLSLAGTSLSARALSIEQRGQYYYLLAVAATVGQLTNPGLQYSNTYFGLQDPKNFGKIIGNSLAISLVLTNIVALLVASALHIIGPMKTFPPPLIFATAGLASSSLLNTYGQQLLLALGRSRVYFWSAFSYDLGNFGAILLTFAYFRNVQSLTLMLVVSAFVVNLVLWRIILLDIDSPVQIDMTFLRKSSGYSMRMFWACLTMGFFSRMQIFIAKFLYPDSRVGIISVASQCCDLLQTIPITFGSFLFPRLVANKDDRADTTRKSLLVVAVLAISAALLLALGSHTLVTILFGVRYDSVPEHLGGMLVGGVFAAMTAILLQYFAAIGQPLIGIACIIANIVLYVGFGIYSTHRIGSQGLALTHSVANASLFLCLWLASGLSSRGEHEQTGQVKTDNDRNKDA